MDVLGEQSVVILNSCWNQANNDKKKYLDYAMSCSFPVTKEEAVAKIFHPSGCYCTCAVILF